MNVGEDTRRGHPVQRLGKSCQLQFRSLGDPCVELTQKLAAILGIVLPGVFSVKNDWHYPAPRRMVPDFLQTGDKIAYCTVCAPLGIGKAYQVGEGMVTEKQVELTASRAKQVG